ncbi:MAG: hypothetical protein AABZ30_02200 [Myxococcota bacterium]
MLSPLLAALATAEVGPTRVSAYGALRVDAIVDDSRTDSIQKPFYVPSESGAAADDAGFSLHPRLSRLGLDADSGALSGKLEVDFQNGPSSESRQMLRIRHAWLAANAGPLRVLAGQTWDVVAPLFPTANGDTLMWNAGNLGDRRPQARASFARGWLEAAIAATMTGAVEGRDFGPDTNGDGAPDPDGFPDGQDAAVPGGQARVGVRWRWISGGVSGAMAWQEAALPKRERFRSQAVAIDLEVKPHWRVALRGEAFAGRDLADLRGGIGQGIAADGTMVRAAGGWAEIAVRPLRAWAVVPGISIDDPKNADLATGMRARNRTASLANVVELDAHLKVGAEYVRWTTDHVDLPRGTDNRANLWVSYAP